MTAIESLLAGLFDYAGLYPPASLGLRSAANNYLEYRRGVHRPALGRFIVNLDRLEELRSITGDSLGELPLSVIAPEDADWESLARQIESGLHIGSVEIKCNPATAIEQVTARIPRGLVTYYEVPINAIGHDALDAIGAAGARAKIRMGGVVPEAFPSIRDGVQMLASLARLRLPFKATAGLHHPVRSMRPLTYRPQGPTGMMHGFLNLSCAAALLYSGGDIDAARLALAEEDTAAWKVETNALHWRDHSWTADQLAILRQKFFLGIGSCSFEEPIHDLESLGWL